MKENIAYCGLDCDKCDAYIATVKNDDALREKTAKYWSKLNGVTILPEQINCEGCRRQGVKTVYCDSLCPIRRCATEKGVVTCGNCDKLGECQTVAIVVANNEEALNNLKRNK